MSYKTKTFTTQSDKEVQVSIASPSQFILEHQQQLLPNWNISIHLVILLLQQSSISLKEFNNQVIQEKDCLRANFLRWGTSLIFALQDLGYKSDLFDPRDGYPLLSQPGKSTLDDNAVVKASLDYPLINYNGCSVVKHPTWGDQVYPGTIVTAAPQDAVTPLIKNLLAD
ncbi:MAG: methylmalonic aciduria and homocystinuria type D protein [Pleurocapsa sp.]